MADIISPLRTDAACSRCEYGKTSQTVCCAPSGPRGASIMLVGEALGADEEAYGRAFVGDAGRKLNYCLAKAGIARRTLRIDNCVRCRPPGNKTPSNTILERCYPYLWYEILRCKPRVIVALGGIASKVLLGQYTDKAGKLKFRAHNVDHNRGFYREVPFRWESAKGRVFEHSCWVVPVYHPAACLRNWELDDLLVRDLEIAKSLAGGREPLSQPQTNVAVYREYADAKRLLERLRRVESFVVDVETTGGKTGLDPHAARIMCIGFCWKPGEAHILPLIRQGGKEAWPRNQRDALVRELADLLEQSALCGQNLKFDVQHLRKLTGVSDFRIAFDTMVAHSLIDENKPHNLTFLCQWYLGWVKYDSALDQYKEKFGRKTVINTLDVPDPILWEYCGYDVDGTWQVMQRLRPLLVSEKVVTAWKNQSGLILPLADTEFRGMQVSRKRIDELQARYSAEQEKHTAALQRAADRYLGEAGAGFNPNSNPQIIRLLVAAGAKLKKTTPGNSLSADKFVLGGLSLRKDAAGRIASHLMGLRTVSRYLSMYLAGDPNKEESLGIGNWLREHDRIHPNYNLATARTGRLSADDPPIQTVPRSGSLRSIVVPDTPDCVLIAVDYEKIELCVLAWLSNDPIMVRELQTGVDLHKHMAVTVRLNRIPTDDEFERIAPDISKNERALAKGVNFGIPYGRGAHAIAEANPDAFPLGMSPRDRRFKVQRIIDAYFEKYSGVAAYRDRQIDRLHRSGFIRSYLYGRKRRLSGIGWYGSKWGEGTSKHDFDLAHLEREAMNFEIQDTANAIVIAATRRVFDGMRRVRFPGFRIILSLHDALVFNCHKRYAERAHGKIREWMEITLPRDEHHRYEMPMRVEILDQPYWGAEYEEG